MGWQYVSGYRQECESNDPGAERQLRGEGFRPQGAGRREQPSALGNLDYADDHDQASVSTQRSVARKALAEEPARASLFDSDETRPADTPAVELCPGVHFRQARRLGLVDSAIERLLSAPRSPLSAKSGRSPRPLNSLRKAIVPAARRRSL